MEIHSQLSFGIAILNPISSEDILHRSYSQGSVSTNYFPRLGVLYASGRWRHVDGGGRPQLSKSHAIQ